MPKAKRRYSFGAHLIAFALVVSLPVTALAGILLLNATNVVRTQANSRLLQLAESLSANIDRDMERHTLVLNTLSTLPSFQQADWRTFDAQAKTALRGNGYIVLIDSAYRQLVNTYVPYGHAPAHTGDVETANRVRASQQPEVSNRFTSLVTGGYVFNVDLPIVRDGQLRYILIYGRPVGYLSAILRAQSLEPGWTSSVYDRNGTPIVANLRAGSSAAQPLSASERVMPGSSRLSQRTDAAGDAVLRVVHTSAATGWTVTIDVPVAAVSGAINGSVRWWLLLALTSVLLAIALGALFGHFLSRQLRGAAAYAEAMGREEAAPPQLASSLQEVDSIVKTLSDARSELGRRMEEQRLLSRELNHRVKNVLSVVQAIVKRTLAESRPVAEAREAVMQRLQTLGKSQDLLMRSDWRALPLAQIVAMELAPFADRVAFEGPAVLVASAKVQNFALLLHELTTNAVKYGALRDGEGKIAIHWSVDERGAIFHFRWKEHCILAVGVSVEKEGFGSTLIRRSFGGGDCTHRFELEPDGLIYELAIPLATIGALGTALPTTGPRPEVDTTRVA